MKTKLIAMLMLACCFYCGARAETERIFVIKSFIYAYDASIEESLAEVRSYIKHGWTVKAQYIATDNGILYMVFTLTPPQTKRDGK